MARSSVRGTGGLLHGVSDPTETIIMTQTNSHGVWDAVAFDAVHYATELRSDRQAAVMPITWVSA
jgi:hypothetical protein